LFLCPNTYFRVTHILRALFVLLGVRSTNLVHKRNDIIPFLFGGGKTDGTKIVQWNYHAGTNQRWELVDVGGGYYKIKNVKSGKVLDVTGGSTAEGALVVQWTDNGGQNQQWQVVSFRLVVDTPKSLIVKVVKH
jgi:hypothetical protein